MPPQQSSPRSSALVRRWRRRCMSGLGSVWKGTARLWEHFAAAIGRIRRRDQLLAILLLMIWIVLLLGNFYFRGVSRFEGSLITQAMSFTYVGDVDKRFINSIDNITRLTLQGKQPASLILNGKFSSPDPSLNLKLQPLSQLEIQLTTPFSELTLETDNPKQTPAITLGQVRIIPNTQVEQLTYLPSTNQLKFCLQTSSVEFNGCEDPSLIEPNPLAVGSLEFGVNPSKVDLYLVNTEIPALGIDDATLETQLRWQPQGQDFTLQISSPALLQIGLPNLLVENVRDGITRFIRGDIRVKNVRFTQLDRTGNVNDDIETSEILDGEVRMMGQSLKLQPEQFLIIPTDRDFDKPNCRISPTDNPGIQRLRDIRINAKDPQGLQTLFSGESKCLAIGLYQRFPTQSIEPSWLLKYLPQEGINAIYTLIGAFTGILFPRLFPEKEDPKP